jgi:hypothetical protein
MSTIYDQYPAEDAAQPRPPQSALWLVYLFFRPRRFFEYMSHFVTRYTVVYTAYLYGLAAAIDNFQLEMTKGDFTGKERPLAELIGGSWSNFWALTLISGLIHAIMYYGVGGWWYRQRLKWCSVPDPDPAEARRVYVFASLVWALPAVIFAAAATARTATPQAAEESTGWGEMVVLLVALFWSYYVSYRGTRTVFQAAPWRARLWFVILPAGLQVAVLGAVIIGIIVLGLIGGTTAEDLRNPVTISHPPFEFKHPAKWFVEYDEESQVPHYSFQVESLIDAGAGFFLDEIPEDPQDATERYLENYRENFVGGGGEPFTAWGNLTGYGWSYFGTYEGSRYLIRIFSTSTDTHSLTVAEYCHEDILETETQGFELIRSTFRWKPVSAPPPPDPLP